MQGVDLSLLQPRIAEWVEQAIKKAMHSPRGWNMEVQTYVKAGNIPVARNCFAFMFTNIGDSIAFVNQMVIFPSATPATSLGDSRTISGHWMDVFKGKLSLKFDPIVATPRVEIVQLFYHPQEFQLSRL